MVPLFAKCLQDFIELMDRKAEQGEEFDILHYYKLLTLDIISETAFGVELSSSKFDGKRKNKALEIINAVLESFFQPNLSMKLFLLIPGLSPLLNRIETFRRDYLNSGLFAPRADLHKMMDEVVRNRKKAGNACQRHDLLQMMLEVEEDNVKPEDLNGLKGLSVEEITGQASTFIVAGYEVTMKGIYFY